MTTPDPVTHCAGCGQELARVGTDGWISAIDSSVWCQATFGTHEPNEEVDRDHA